MQVDCVVRADAASTSGGDLVQIREYVRFLEAWGVDVREVPFHPAMRLRPGAVVHIFNIDRPFDFLVASRTARRSMRVVSPIHHNLARVRAMRSAHGSSGAPGLARRILPETVAEWAGSVVRALRGAGRGGIGPVVAMAVRSAPWMLGVWRRVGAELDDASAVALLADGEGADLRQLTAWHGRNAVLVPNGRPEDLDLAAARPWAERAPGSILVVGRIEPRKRQLELARSAHRLGIPVTFVGVPANPDDLYTRAFEELAAASPFVQYAGGVDRQEVMRVMGRSRVLVNASWVEVQSLVDLEAAFMGCAVVATRAGHSAEWLGDAVTLPGDEDPDTLLQVAQALAAAETRDLPPLSYDWTWERSAAVLHDLYRRES